MELSGQQGRAVQVMAGQIKGGASRLWLAGYAGSGKSTIIPHIIEACGARRPLLCAPTNKAARVIAAKTGRQAMSIHKAVYFPPGEDEASRLTWEVCPEGPASNADLIIVDEASMVGSRLGSDLESFGVPIIAIGDPGQLPPVQDVPHFCVGEPDFMLTEIHRQALDNPIIRLSQDIREGARLRPGRMGDAVTIAAPGEIEIDQEALPQIIVGTHRRRWAVTSTIREVMGHQGWLPQSGEPLLCKKNSTETRLINGMLCTTVNCRQDGAKAARVNLIDDDGNWLEVDAWTGLFAEHRDRRRLERSVPPRDLEAFDFGWAITCHSAQGSQWPDVLVYDEGHVFKDDAARWRYTACTRAAEKLTIIV